MQEDENQRPYVSAEARAAAMAAAATTGVEARGSKTSVVDDNEFNPEDDEITRQPILIQTIDGPKHVHWTTSHRMLGPQMESNHSLGTDYDITERIRATKKVFFARLRA